jgi:hypothetical protein
MQTECRQLSQIGMHQPQVAGSLSEEPESKKPAAAGFFTLPGSRHEPARKSGYALAAKKSSE